MNERYPINTKAPYRIDVHHHVLPAFYLEALDKIGNRETFGIILPDWTLDAHLVVMDKIKIAVGMASIPAVGVDFQKHAPARGLARRCNEYIAGLQNDHPSRFGSFATLPMPDAVEATQEAQYALDTLRMDGVTMISNVFGRYVGDPVYDELFAELNRRKAVVYIHPGNPPEQGIPASIHFPVDTGLETARAAMSLLYGGVLAKYPEVRFIFSHCGGITPYLADRIVRGQVWIGRDGSVDPGMLEEAPPQAAAVEALKQLQRQYYDSMTANAGTGWDILQAFVDPSHILFGTDHAILPAKFQTIKMRELMGYKGFDEAVRIGVERENALRLFPRLSEVI